MDQKQKARPENEHQVLLRRMCRGVPDCYRGMVWQTLANCRGSETTFLRLARTESSWEERLLKDIDRTFPTMEFFQRTRWDGANQSLKCAESVHGL